MKEKILIIEDDKFLRDLMELKLKEGEYEVLTSVDGEEGLKTSKQEKPELILLDIILPNMSGWDVLKALKQDSDLANIPVILLTNLGEESDVQKGLELGAVDYMVKAHFTPEEIITKVALVLKK
ncbi:response regulator [bacterium]|nr:response regulator [bacterium]|tara:strand:- start:2834 stop:3205 length:372 start_codon:yes stop_codon:yes gene_type:complete